jgi:uncharacterized membrane protein
MADVPVQLIIAAFQDENGADAALKQIQQAKKDGWIRIDNAAVIRRDANDKLHIKDVRDMGGGKGAVIGGVIGAVVGVIFPPAVLASAGIGAVAGGLIAKFSDGGLPDSRLREIGEALKPGTSAIVAIIEHTWVAEAEAQLAAEGAQVFVNSVKADIAEQLASGHDLSYSAVTTGEAMSLDRVAGNQDEVSASNLTMTSAGLTATSVVANKEGTQVAAMATDGEQVVAAVASLPPMAELAASAGAAPAAEASAPEAPAAEAAAPAAEEVKPEAPQA